MISAKKASLHRFPRVSTVYDKGEGVTGALRWIRGKGENIASQFQWGCLLMPKIAASPISPARNLPMPDEIRAELRAILTSPSFHGSKRCQQFLGYVCEKSLSGEAATLKERTVAVEVFGRRPQSDLGDDTIVRVSAREVRKRLVQFYASPEGAASLVNIDLVSGSYVPEFRYAGATREQEHRPLAVAVDPPRRQPS